MNLALMLAGTRVGRIILAIGAALLAAGIVALRIFSAGKASAAAQQARQSLDSLRNRKQTDEEVARRSDADVRERLGRWVPDDERR